MRKRDLQLVKKGIWQQILPKFFSISGACLARVSVSQNGLSLSPLCLLPIRALECCALCQMEYASVAESNFSAVSRCINVFGEGVFKEEKT